MDWAMKGRINLGFLLTWAVIYTVTIAAASTFGHQWRQRHYDLLTNDGYNVAVVQNPTLSLPADAAGHG